MSVTLTAVSVAEAVTLPIYWDASGGEVTKYRIYRAPAPAGPFALLKTVTVPTARVEVPVPGAGCYRVRAVDSLGQVSPDSAGLCLTITTEVLP